MDAQTVILGVAIAYLVVMIGIGLWANSKMTSSKEFLVAGQSLGFFVMAIASFSSIQSGWGMVGASGTTSAWGPAALVAGAFLAPLGPFPTAAQTAASRSPGGAAASREQRPPRPCSVLEHDRRRDR